MLAAGLVALLRYSFGSLFVVGESVAASLLGTADADIEGTMQRLQAHPLLGLLQYGAGLALALAAASLAFERTVLACALAGASAAWAWQCGMSVAAVLLLAGGITGLAGSIAPRP
jgi:hypothetical protein